MISASWSNFCARAVLEHVAGGRANLSEGGCVGAAHCVWSISRGPFFGTRKWTQKWGRPIKLHYKTSSKMALVLGPPMPILVILLSGGSCRKNSGLIWPLYILIFRAWVGEGALAKAWRPIVWAWLCQEQVRAAKRPIKLHYKTSSYSGLIWPLYILIFRAWVGEGALAKAWRPIVWAWLCQEQVQPSA